MQNNIFNHIAMVVPNRVGSDDSQKANTLTSDVTTIINAVIGILGLVSVVVMIIGGVNYMTSSGDAGKVKKAKDTILYGLIGLIVCALAFALVNWVLGSVLQQSTGQSAEPEPDPYSIPEPR